MKNQVRGCGCQIVCFNEIGDTITDAKLHYSFTYKASRVGVPPGCNMLS